MRRTAAPKRILDRRVEPVRVDLLQREGLHRLHGVQRFVGDAAGVGDAVLRRARKPAHAAAQHDQRHDDHRDQHHQDRPVSLRLVTRQHHEAADQREGGAQRDRKVDARDRLHQRRVRRQAREHLADAGDLEERRVHADDARVDGRAQVGHDALAEPAHEVEAQRREHAEDRRRRQERDEVLVDRVAALRRDPVVDQVTQRDRQGQHRGGCHQQGEERQHQDAAVGAQVRHQRPQGAERTRLRAVCGDAHCACTSRLRTLPSVICQRIGSTSGASLRSTHASSAGSGSNSNDFAPGPGCSPQ